VLKLIVAKNVAICGSFFINRDEHWEHHQLQAIAVILTSLCEVFCKNAVYWFSMCYLVKYVLYLFLLDTVICVGTPQICKSLVEIMKTP